MEQQAAGQRQFSSRIEPSVQVWENVTRSGRQGHIQGTILFSEVTISREAYGHLRG